MERNPQNRIDPTPVKLSTNVTVARQTPKTDFGERLRSGLDSAAGAVANGAAIAAPFVPGGAIVSAAVSSVSQMSHAQTGAPPSTTGAYMAAGVIDLRSGESSGTGGGALSSVTSTTQTAGAGSSVYSQSPTYMPGGSTTSGGTMGALNADLSAAAAENMKLLQVQVALQRENQVFSAVSNVLKTRHDTVKNSISNVR